MPPNPIYTPIDETSSHATHFHLYLKLREHAIAQTRPELGFPVY